MKTLITSIFILLVINILPAQTINSSLDSLMFNKINELRARNSIKPLKFDTSAYLMAHHHAMYLFAVGEITHREKIKVDSLKKLERMSDRFDYFSDKTSLRISENCGRSYRIGNFSDETMLLILLNAWIESKYHYEILLSEQIDKGAVSVVINKRNKIVSTSVGDVEVLVTEIYGTFSGIKFLISTGNQH